MYVRSSVLNKILLMIPAILITLWVLLPIYWMIVASLVPEVQISRLNLFPRLDQLSLQNYVELLTPGDIIQVKSRGLQKYLWNSVVIASFVTLLSLIA